MKIRMVYVYVSIVAFIIIVLVIVAIINRDKLKEKFSATAEKTTTTTAKLSNFEADHSTNFLDKTPQPLVPISDSPETTLTLSTQKYSKVLSTMSKVVLVEFDHLFTEGNMQLEGKLTDLEIDVYDITGKVFVKIERRDDKLILNGVYEYTDFKAKLLNIRFEVDNVRISNIASFDYNPTHINKILIKSSTKIKSIMFTQKNITYNPDRYDTASVVFK